jgi:ribosomal protein L25 (general stress protein Ctc)
MGANSRNKGATFERDIAIALELELGIRFKRNLEQSREADHADLIPDDPDFPFVIECKRYAGGTFQRAWWDQVNKAARAQGKIPCVIYKFDRRDIQVAVDWRAFAAMIGVALSDDGLIHINLASLCFMAREIMARRYN